MTDTPEFALREAMERINALETLVAEQLGEIAELRAAGPELGEVDALTGMPNLAGLMRLIEHTVARRNRYGEDFGLMTVRIDSLDEIPRAHHAHCDAVRHAGALIAAGLRDLDVVGRVPDGAFFAVLPMLEPGGAPAVAARIERHLGAVPFRNDDRSATFEPALGLLFPPRGRCREPSRLVAEVLELASEAKPGAPVIRRADRDA